MAMEMRLALRQTQRMIMTQSLQQAIGLLQLSRLELIQAVRQELEENPILDEEVLEEEQVSEEASGEEEKEGQDDDPLADFDWESYLEDASDYRRESPREEVEHWSPEERLTRPRSLSDHLLFQLHLSTSDSVLIHWATEIIGNLDENGYLPESLEEVRGKTSTNLAVLEEALRLVQSFDPVGVAARDLRECLLLQIDNLKDGGEVALARTLIAEHLVDLEGRYFTRIAEKLRVPIKAIQDAVVLICSLEPKPGRTFSSEEPRYITPDVYILKVDDRFVVVLNEDGLPRLRISSYYRGLLRKGQGSSKETREYVEGKMRSALWLIRSIEQRQRTLFKVSESIVKFQRDFLENGITRMRPLTLKEVAEDISMHESTVSRVTTNKYVHTPEGLFELKYFFHRGVHAVNGEAVSSLTVKELVRRLLTTEDTGKPLSDQKIVEVLRHKGIEIARRTVAKYRGQLKIPSSSRRRRY
jgi:RNA polymerase sigma-54 factor